MLLRRNRWRSCKQLGIGVNENTISLLVASHLRDLIGAVCRRVKTEAESKVGIKQMDSSLPGMLFRLQECAAGVVRIVRRDSETTALDSIP